MDERRLWLEATPSVAFERPCVEVSAEIVKQIRLDLTRTFGPMLFRESFDEEAVNSRRKKVEESLIKWLERHEDFVYMQGMNHVMAICYREMEADEGAIQVFDHMLRQINEKMFHTDAMKLFEAVQSTAAQLRCMVRDVSQEMAVKLTEADVDFFPMIIQNWMIDIFVNVLPADAAARLWHHILLDKMPGVPLRFASNLLLSSRHQIMKCRPEDLNDEIAKIPMRIKTPQDVDVMLEMDLTAPAVPVKVVPTTLKLQARPKAWKPWKFLAVAMVVPWRFMHAAVYQPCAFAARPPVSHRPCLKGLRTLP